MVEWSHIDIYPQPASYDDMMARYLKWAQAVKAADPSALVSGPMPSGWSGMLFSSLDMHNGWGKSSWQYWDNPLDYQAHGSVYWIPYYLQQMKQFEQQNGHRLLDAVDNLIGQSNRSSSLSGGSICLVNYSTAPRRSHFIPVRLFSNSVLSSFSTVLPAVAHEARFAVRLTNCW